MKFSLILAAVYVLMSSISFAQEAVGDPQCSLGPVYTCLEWTPKPFHPDRRQWSSSADMPVAPVASKPKHRLTRLIPPPMVGWMLAGLVSSLTCDVHGWNTLHNSKIHAGLGGFGGTEWGFASCIGQGGYQMTNLALQARKIQKKKK